MHRLGSEIYVLIQIALFKKKIKKTQPAGGKTAPWYCVNRRRPSTGTTQSHVSGEARGFF
jgi:hypothetical protein